MEKEALYYTLDDKGRVKCGLCPHGCLIEEGKSGICNTRKAEKSKLYAMNYGEVSSLSLDPVEKKPLYHFRPGTMILSAGSYGCNFRCNFCQNYEISMMKPMTQYFSKESLIDTVETTKNSGNVGIAFTYNEPSVWYEYVFDVFRDLKKEDPSSSTVLVTNGFIEREPLEKLLPYTDAMNIDLKAFNENYYRTVCGGTAEKVKKTIKVAAKSCHVEITTLLVNGMNDSEKEIRDLSEWISSLDTDIPLHLSRYYPAYKSDIPPTDADTIMKAKEIAESYLKYVYIGNVPGVDSNTYCPDCGELLVERSGYRTRSLITSPQCPSCKAKINIIL